MRRTPPRDPTPCHPRAQRLGYLVKAVDMRNSTFPGYLVLIIVCEKHVHLQCPFDSHATWDWRQINSTASQGRALCQLLRNQQRVSTEL
ncbi:hypothetical protein NEUTE2DRAFT_132893 [Neurospora tetrasperma FGSC 2509]|nr:hypothetical protein NEUTE2DRAFT_132893 [Neurospora tetrasperma FGSC 2509]